MLLPGYTRVVVPNALHYAGLKTVYSDIELDTYGLDASRIEKKISPKTRAALLRHDTSLYLERQDASLR